MRGVDADRVPPIGTPDLDINYVCSAGIGDPWAPTEADVEQLIAEGKQQADMVRFARAAAQSEGRCHLDGLAR
eukprot:14846535-Heterocapsa_arctica.AAC.1